MAKLTDVKTLDMQDGKVTRVSYAGAEYVATLDEVDRGDIVLAIASKFDISAGQYYEVNRVGICATVLDNVNHSNERIFDDAVTVFRKQSATTKTPDLAQRVDSIDARVSALELAKQAPAHTFKQGDYARMKTNDGALVGFSAGDIVQIGGVSDGIFDLRVFGNGNVGYADVSNLEPVDAPAPPKPAPAPTFKAGDYAKVTGFTPQSGPAGNHMLDAGTIVEVERVAHGALYGLSYRTHTLTGRFAAVSAADLETATNAEVAQAVAQAKRAAKFTALGRKVDGDFKKGDLVRVTDTYGAGDGIEVGDIVEVSRTESGNARVACKDFVGNWSVGADLIAPVEARVDAN